MANTFIMVILSLPLVGGIIYFFVLVCKAWEDYASVMPDLHENWHIYAIDVYGHGESTHEQLLSDIEIPCVYLHVKEDIGDNEVYLCAASKEQADRAAVLIGDNCHLIETEDIFLVQPK